MDCEHPTGHHRCQRCGRFVRTRTVQHYPDRATGSCGCTGHDDPWLGRADVTCEPQ